MSGTCYTEIWKPETAGYKTWKKAGEVRMVNEEKVRLMAKAASFEAGEGKQALSMNRFFRGDYISLQSDRGVDFLYGGVLPVRGALGLL